MTRSISQRRLIATSIASILLLDASLTYAATTWTVNTCSEGTVGTGHVGSLRYATANATSGDIVDMSALPCGVLSLSTGSIQIPQNDLTILGPGEDHLYITGEVNGTTQSDRVLTHTGTGTLTLRDMSIADAHLKSTNVAYGGCVYSTGNISLDHVTVTHCMAESVALSPDRVEGGGLFSRGTLAMQNSTVTGNTAIAGNGGGAYAYAGFSLRYSSITNNTAYGVGAIGDKKGNSTLANSLISGNHAHGTAGIFVWAITGDSVLISNSTIANNTADIGGGGVIIEAKGGTAQIHNSTIAFNSVGATPSAAGVSVVTTGGGTLLDLQSSIIANNSVGASQDLDLMSAVPIATNSMNNLVRVTATDLPPGNSIGVCPLLASLRDNGGPTRTLSLYSGSPAIDDGSNPDSLNSDQRGPLLGFTMYPRVDHGQADIGAYEVNQIDIVFNSSFEGCAALPSG